MSDTSPGRNGRRPSPSIRLADDAEANIQRTQHRAEDRIEDARDAATPRVRRTETAGEGQGRGTPRPTVRKQIADVAATPSVVAACPSRPRPGRSSEAVEQATRAAPRHRPRPRRPPGQAATGRGARREGQDLRRSGAVGVLAVAGAAALGLKQRGERKRVEREARAHAAAIARYLPQAADEPRDRRGRRWSRGGLVLLGAHRRGGRGRDRQQAAGAARRRRPVGAGLSGRLAVVTDDRHLLHAPPFELNAGVRVEPPWEHPGRIAALRSGFDPDRPRPRRADRARRGAAARGARPWARGLPARRVPGVA